MMKMLVCALALALFSTVSFAADGNGPIKQDFITKSVMARGSNVNSAEDALLPKCIAKGQKLGLHFSGSVQVANVKMDGGLVYITANCLFTR